jgi:hypothetical protein
LVNTDFELISIVDHLVAVWSGNRRNSQVAANAGLMLQPVCHYIRHARSGFVRSIRLTLRTTASVTRAEQCCKAPALRAVTAAPAALAVVAAPPRAPPPTAADALPALAQFAMLGTPFCPATVPPPVGTLTQYVHRLARIAWRVAKGLPREINDLSGYMTNDH